MFFFKVMICHTNIVCMYTHTLGSFKKFNPHPDFYFLIHTNFCMSLINTEIKTEILISFSRFIRSLLPQQNCWAMASLFNDPDKHISLTIQQNKQDK